MQLLVLAILLVVVAQYLKLLMIYHVYVNLLGISILVVQYPCRPFMSLEDSIH